MGETKGGTFAKLIDALFFKIPWYVYAGVLVGVPLVVTALFWAIPAEAGYAMGAPVALAVLIVAAYVSLGLLLQAAMKVSHADDYTDLAYKLFLARSKWLLAAVWIVFMGAGAFLAGYAAQDMDSSNFLGGLIAVLLCEVSVALFVVGFYGLFGLGVKLVLHITGWCPACGKFFAMKTTSREVVGSQEISVKRKVDTRNGRGEVIATQDQYIPGTREIVEKVKTCKHCGCTLTSHKVRDYANV